MGKVDYFFDETKIKLLNHDIKEVKLQEYDHSYIPDSVWVTGAPIMWNQSYQGDGCKIGIIDTGIDNTHPDLKNNVLFRRDYVKDNNQPQNFNPHGTHVAGTVAANGLIKGIAPLAKLIDYRVLGNDGSGSYFNITKAVNDSVNDGCNIINMSLGGPFDYVPLHNAIKNAVNRNVLVVVAAGNEGPNKISYPAFYPEVLCVGAVNFNKDTGVIDLPFKPWFSNSNREVDIAADGWQILSTVPNNSYGYSTGTSMSSPNVTGISALLWNRYNKKIKKPTYDQLFGLAKSTTVDILEKNNDYVSGAGFATLYPELPKKVDGNWDLPNMQTGKP